MKKAANGLSFPEKVRPFSMAPPLQLRKVAVWAGIVVLGGLWLLSAKDMAGSIAQASLSGLIQTVSWPAIGYLMLGIAIGFWVGILPGLGGPVTMALMLGFVTQFKMAPVEAFAFLLGMMGVVATTGDITSILFGIPGESATAATIVEGHVMAKKGEAGRALGAALFSSLIGAIIGAVSIAMAIPIVTPLVMSFGSPEFFMLTMSGVVFVGALSGGNVLKGLAAGGLGFLFSLVGLDPQSGSERYTFGQLYLWGSGERGGGVGLIPATVGLFAIPEIIDLAVMGGSISHARLGKLGGVMEGVKDCFRHWWLIARCSAIGTFLGIIPGIGAPISQWFAYAHAMQSAGKEEKVGTGQVEGVLGPGAANNSSLGGHLIPMVAFGVPGTITAAILLGAFIMLGLQPGPAMLTKNLDVTLSLVWILIVSNIITVGICFLVLDRLAQLTQIRGSVLIPILLLFMFIGSYTESNSFNDILVMLIFGILGWAMLGYGWSRPALLLGLVLGRLSDNFLWLSYSRYGLGFLTRPVAFILLLVILASVFYPVLRKLLGKDALSIRGEA